MVRRGPGDSSATSRVRVGALAVLPVLCVAAAVVVWPYLRDRGVGERHDGNDAAGAGEGRTDDANVASPPDPPETPPVRRFTAWHSTTEAALVRIAEAEAARLPVVKELFREASVPFPPAEMVLRVFKRERRLELWAGARGGGELTHVTTYSICRASGELGPKRREGDFQVPEGFYTLSGDNPASRYHLALLVNYPNLSDRILGDPNHPGDQIMIHGRCASVGCLAMSDERDEEIWVAVSAFRKAGGVVAVHLLPTRDMAGLLASDEHPEHHAFWANLKVGDDLFRQRMRLPVVRVDATGRYRFR